MEECVSGYQLALTCLDGQCSPLFPSSRHLFAHLPCFSHFSVICSLSPMFFIPIFLLGFLSLFVHHLFLDKDYIKDLSTTRKGRISWTLRLPTNSL